MTDKIFTAEEKAIRMERALIRCRDTYWADISSTTAGKHGVAHARRCIDSLNEVLNLPCSSPGRLFDAVQGETA